MTPPRKRISAVVLAGGRNKPEMALETGIQFRSMLPVHGRPMVSCVIEALQRASTIGQVFVVGTAPPTTGIEKIEDHGGFVENIYAGIEAAGGDEALIATSDIPFLTSDAVDDFVTLAQAADADIVYPIVLVSDCYRQFPGVKRTAVRLKEGAFTGGNMMVVQRGFMEAQREALSRAYALRKSPVKLAAMVGYGTTARLVASMLTRRAMLSIPELESAISRLLGGRARAVISAFPEIATDIDRPSDLEAVESLRIRPAS